MFEKLKAAVVVISAGSASVGAVSVNNKQCDDMKNNGVGMVEAYRNASNTIAAGYGVAVGAGAAALCLSGLSATKRTKAE